MSVVLNCFTGATVLLQLLKRDTDAESTSAASSAEMYSNTDSGHGASEEGRDHTQRRLVEAKRLNRTPDGQERDQGALHVEGATGHPLSSLQIFVNLLIRTCMYIHVDDDLHSSLLYICT